MKKIFKVVQQGETSTVPAPKAEGGQMNKCLIVLQEFGGKYENQFAATMLGNLAACRFYPGEYVVAALRFTTHEYNGQIYQDVLANDIIKINK